MSPSPTDPTHEDNWSGGFYELSIKLGPADDARLEAALVEPSEVERGERGVLRGTPEDGLEVEPVRTWAWVVGRIVRRSRASVTSS